jgi:hypothetical protein
MAWPTLYCTLADVLALVSLDQQARLATDQGVVPIGVGDGLVQTFETPFTGATSVKTYVAGVETPNTLSPGTGPDGVDQVVFAEPPDAKALVSGQANLGAVNVAVIKQCISMASNEIKRYLARYGTESLPPDVLEILESPAIFYTRWFLRERRGMNEYAPIIEQKKSVDAWLMGVATGRISLAADAPIAQAEPPSPSPVIAEPSVFEPPYSSTSVNRSYLW